MPDDDAAEPQSLNDTAEAQPLTVEVQDDGGVAVLVVRGELDVYSSPALDAAVDQVLGDGARSLVLDLGEVGFIDSSGLRSMIRARQQAGSSPDAVRIRNPQPATVRLLDITGLTDHFPTA
jgi:anti-sigma B factor antagonist